MGFSCQGLFLGYILLIDKKRTLKQKKGGGFVINPKEKVVDSLAGLKIACRKLKNEGQKIVLTSGCFDLLHGGHLQYLYDAGRMGYLVVGINSDAFVKRLKGNGRPIRDEQDRAFVAAGFLPVRLVAIFNDDYELIKAVRPHVYVASATSHVRVWADKQRVALLRSLGTKIVELKEGKQDSTTNIIARAMSAR